MKIDKLPNNKVYYYIQTVSANIQYAKKILKECFSGSKTHYVQFDIPQTYELYFEAYKELFGNKDPKIIYCNQGCIDVVGLAEMEDVIQTSHEDLQLQKSVKIKKVRLNLENLNISSLHEETIAMKMLKRRAEEIDPVHPLCYSAVSTTALIIIGIIVTLPIIYKQKTSTKKKENRGQRTDSHAHFAEKHRRHSNPDVFHLRVMVPDTADQTKASPLCTPTNCRPPRTCTPNHQCVLPPRPTQSPSKYLVC
nr:unnamed protein product [Callosobruchus analis]